MTMIVAMVAMIGMTGFAAAMDTNVQYNGDGSYDCNYNAYGTGSIGIHTHTSDGSDHLVSGWTNTEANGWQQMDTYTVTAHNTDYSGTVISRTATVGGADDGEDEAGFIITLTTDNDNNSVYTYANYHDDRGYGSHVTTDQSVVVGSLVGIGQTQYNVTGVAAVTRLHGFAYGDNTTVSGLVRTQSGDEYTYAYLVMENGRMNLFALSAAGSIYPALWGVYDGACGQLVSVDAEGIGTFGAGAGTDMHGAYFDMEDDLGTMYYYSDGYDVNISMSTTFDGDFDAWGYIYAVNLNPTPPI